MNGLSALLFNFSCAVQIIIFIRTKSQPLSNTSLPQNPTNQPQKQSNSKRDNIKSQNQPLSLITPLIDISPIEMKSNIPFGKNTKQLEEEYRLIEELMNTENKYNAMRFKQILADLKSKDEIKILDAVTQLSAELSMAQEENMASFQLDYLIPELVNCLHMEGIPEIMRIIYIFTKIIPYSPRSKFYNADC